MNRLAAALAIMLVSSFAHALAPVSVETDWNEKTVSLTTTGVSAATVDVGGFGSSGFAVLGGSYTANGVDGVAAGTVLTVSSATKNAIGFDYWFYSAASSATLKIAQTLKTPTNPVPANTASYNTPAPSQYYFNVPVISTSTAITLPSATIVSHTFRALVSNPIFYLSGLSPSATYTLTVDYGVPHLQ